MLKNLYGLWRVLIIAVLFLIAPEPNFSNLESGPNPPPKKHKEWPETFGTFGIPQVLWDEIWADDNISDDEKVFMYNSYYQRMPNAFKASATWYGPDANTYGELLWYGAAMRQQMERGWVLFGSGKYGYFDCSLLKTYRCERDNLLSAQKSQMYYYFADRYVDQRGQPIPVPEEDLNDRQRRIFELTKCDLREKACRRPYFASIDEQSQMTPDQALATGKWIAIVSCKSVNDFGRQFLIFREMEYHSFTTEEIFVGVVICGGEAKRDDWTGLGSPTNDGFKFNAFPLSIRVHEGYHWAFDFPTSLYEWFGGTGGHVGGIIAIDPDEREDIWR